MNSRENEKLVAWYYRSDDRPMESRGKEENWTLYNNSKMI